MNTFNTHAEPQQFDDDDDEFGEVEGRPLIGWFLMAVALVAMAFLIGAGPEASASATAPAGASAPVAVAPSFAGSEAGSPAFGG